MAYLAMERLELTPVSDQDLSQRVAHALQCLHSLPAPVEAAIGRLRGGRALHVLFQDHTAPLDFSSIEALERYMNEALKRIRFSTPDPIKIKYESPVFTQSDMDMSNFSVNMKGKRCISTLQSFITYTMSPADESFATKVAGYLNLPPSQNMPSMRRISGPLWIRNLVLTITACLRRGLNLNDPCSLFFVFL